MRRPCRPKSTEPLVGNSSPRPFADLVLPQPDSPTRPKVSPSLIENVTWRPRGSPDLVADESRLDGELLRESLDAQQLFGTDLGRNLGGVRFARLKPGTAPPGGSTGIRVSGGRSAPVRPRALVSGESTACRRKRQPTISWERFGGSPAIEAILACGVLEVRHRGQQRLGVGVAASNERGRSS